jgi:lipopolysaccharide/colanic/teichoic acid biosynthesis glycosyltransferase
MEFSAPNIFDEWYSYYQAARPGLAGTSQAYRHHYRNGRSQEIYRKSAELDLEYFDKASLTTDLGILASTPFDMLKANIDVIENLQAA